ncbi:hypothetical protein D9611_010770 [Ephemerocybe angulata]|uniref:Superoxide dismutase [Mn], mitochondrial n=1 Tax=Ephemerocybe angulata TaxID=980116 RepID=A0A8H5F1T8_9AGAR|nr:hypothetical protein D9611_010770 [Tulosesus angulatus]
MLAFLLNHHHQHSDGDQVLPPPLGTRLARTSHLLASHDAAPHQTQPDLRQRPNSAERTYTKASTPKQGITLQTIINFNSREQPSLFWKNLASSAAASKGNGGVLKDGPLKSVIEQVWGSLDALKKEFNTATLGILGSGWGWLGYNTQINRLEISTTPNQGALVNLVPTIGVDIWEHAFYLQYLNVKPDYLNAIWNVINFEEMEAHLVEASGSSKL